MNFLSILSIATIIALMLPASAAAQAKYIRLAYYILSVFTCFSLLFFFYKGEKAISFSPVTL